MNEAVKSGKLSVNDHGVGYCLKDYAQLVQDSFKGNSDNVAWSFDPLLLSDADHAEALYGQKQIEFPVLDPEAWKTLPKSLSSMTSSEAYLAMDEFKQADRRKVRYDDEFKLENKSGQADFQTKIDMLKLQFKQVSTKNSHAQPTDFYFIDDRKE